MSDLTAKLTLDASQFDSKLKQAEQQAKASGNVIANSINGTKIESELKRANSALTEQQRKLLETAKAAGYFFDSTGRLHNATGKYASQTDALGQRLMQLQRELKRTSIGATELEKELRDVANVSNKLGGSGFSMPSMGLGGAIGSFFGVSETVKAIDTWTTLNNRIRLVTETQEEFNIAQKGVIDTAKQTGQSIDSVASTYQSLARSQKELGLSQEQVAQLTNTISKAMVIGGGSAESNAAALVQLGQAFSSGVLRGEEFNSIMEQAPGLAQALARGLQVPVGSLRGMAEAGQLTSDKVSKALLDMRDSVDMQFGNVNLTISQSAQVLKTYFSEFIGGSSEASGASKVISEGLVLLGKNIDIVATGIGVIVGYKVAAWALGAAKGVALLTAGFVAKTTAATSAALAVNGGAIAMGRAGVAAAAATPSILTLSGAFGVLTAAASRVYLAFAPIAAPIAAATSSLIAFDAAMKFKNGEDASNAISNFVEDLLGIDRQVDSLGIKLYDLLHPDESKIESTIVQEVRSKVSVDIASSSTGLLKELEEAEKNFGLTSTQIKINNELLKIEQELKKESNNQATQESLIRSQNVLVMAKEVEQRRIDTERLKREAEERKKAVESNIQSIKDTIRAKEEEVVQIGKTKAEIEAMKLATKGATTEQQEYLSSLQKMIDANEEQARKQQQINEALAYIEDERKTAGMSDIEKRLYQLEKLGASGGQIASARADLESAKAIKDADEARRQADKEHEREMKKAAQDFSSASSTMKELSDQSTASMSKYDQRNAKWAAIREQERQASMMSVFFGGSSGKASTSASPSVYGYSATAVNKNEQLKTSLPSQSSETIGTINLNVANENGIVKMFSMLGSVKTLKDLSDFVKGGIDTTINNGAMANA